MKSPMEIVEGGNEWRCQSRNNVEALLIIVPAFRFTVNNFRKDTGSQECGKSNSRLLSDTVQMAEQAPSMSMSTAGGRKVSEGPSSRVNVGGGPTADQRLRELTPSTSSLLG